MMSCLLHSLAAIFERLEGCLFTDCKIYIISHSGLWKIIINLDEDSIFVKGQGKILFEKKLFNLILILNSFVFFTHGTLNQYSSFKSGAMHQLWYTHGMVL